MFQRFRNSGLFSCYATICYVTFITFQEHDHKLTVDAKKKFPFGSYRTVVKLIARILKLTLGNYTCSGICCIIQCKACAMQLSDYQQ